MEYSEYLNSEHWKSVKRKFKHQNKNVCVICGEKKNLNIHHMTYENLGKEKFDDLVYLCKSCHELIHKSPNPTMAILKFLKEKSNSKAHTANDNIVLTIQKGSINKILINNKAVSLAELTDTKYKRFYNEAATILLTNPETFKGITSLSYKRFKKLFK